MEKPAQIPDVFCTAPWTHTYASPQGERRLCCASRETPRFQKQYIDNFEVSEDVFNPDLLSQHWNSEYMQDIRKRILAGEKLSQCEVCNDQVLNLHTYRKYFTETLFPDKIEEIYNSTDENGYTTMMPVSFDYRLSNHCNFSCRMCGEQLSSTWEAEKRKHNMWDPKHDKWMAPEMRIPIKEFQHNVLERELQGIVDENNIEEIYWVGGEPLMWPKHWAIMQQLVDNKHAKNVTVRYNTNLSKVAKNDQKLYDLLPHFKHVNLCASIDGIGEIGEYIRSGLRWNDWINNFEAGMFLIDQFGDNAIVFDVTLTLPGLFSMKEMFDLVTELNVKSYFKITFSFDSSVLMSPMLLPRNILDDILDDLIAYCEPKVTHKTQVYVDTFRSMKTRPVFEEEYTDWQDGFARGRKQLLKLEEIRNASLTMERILSNHTGAHSWWTK